jgi:hypothetical protein
MTHPHLLLVQKAYPHINPIADPLPATEKRFSLAQLVARNQACSAALTVNRTTILRWITRGLRLPNGARLYLSAEREGNRWRTTVEAMIRFHLALTTAALDHQQNKSRLGAELGSPFAR